MVLRFARFVRVELRYECSFKTVFSRYSTLLDIGEQRSKFSPSKAAANFPTCRATLLRYKLKRAVRFALNLSRNKFRCCKLRLFKKIMRCVICQQCVFVPANKMACWPSMISFYTSPVNPVLRLCSCFLRQFGEMLNFWHNSSRALDLRGLFLYSGPQVSHRHGCFSSSLHKSFLWASDIFSLINSQSWVSAFSTSTTSAMFTSYPNRTCPRSPSFPRFWCGKIDQSQVLWSVASCDANDKIESLLQKVELRSTLCNMLPQLATSKFVAWQVESEGGNTGNNAFQLAMQQCCATSCAEMLPVLLDLKGLIWKKYQTINRNWNNKL